MRPAPPAGAAASVQLAEALAQADIAAETRNAAGLAQSLATIAALGARPLDASSAAQLAQWQSQSPVPPPMRGRTLGPGYRQGVLAAGEGLSLEQSFLSGQKASIALTAPAGSALLLQVTDSSAKPVCTDRAATVSCQWIPIFTQRHTIRLTNPGQQSARFYLVIE
ncbi:hypothetical protein IP79_11080 [Porphyrobacter sp. AAP60]|nr:hypothetical protein IP79_11080 [Porphyrobacter sp. AAP60]